jgi:hypothetical protein
MISRIQTTLLTMLAAGFIAPSAHANPISIQCLTMFVSVDTEKFTRIADRLQTNAKSQVVTRDSDEYRGKIPGFAERMAVGRSKLGFHWIDVGGGAGSAGIESFAYENTRDKTALYDKAGVSSDLSSQPKIDVNVSAATLAAESPILGQHRVTVVSVENFLESMNDPALHSKLLDQHFVSSKQTFRMKFEYAFAKKLELAHRLRYLHGRKIEDIPDAELGHADLITEFYGAFTYSVHKFEILEKYSRLLKPGGVAIIKAPYPLIKMQIDGKDRLVELDLFLHYHPVAGLTAGPESTLILENVEGTTAALKELTSKMKFHKLDDLDRIPPTYVYEFVP